ncbi:MAG: hypothetical protein ACP5ER_00455 [Candidatus Bathyarchaeales archaeon]
MPREFWEDFFSFHLGPWGVYFGPYRPFRISYRRTSKSHIVRLRINPDVKKEEIKARLIEPGILEIEWPRKIRGEEIPIE